MSMQGQRDNGSNNFLSPQPAQTKPAAAAAIAAGGSINESVPPTPSTTQKKIYGATFAIAELGEQSEAAVVEGYFTDEESDGGSPMPPPRRHNNSNNINNNNRDGDGDGEKKSDEGLEGSSPVVSPDLCSLVEVSLSTPVVEGMNSKTTAAVLESSIFQSESSGEALGCDLLNYDAVATNPSDAAVVSEGDDVCLHETVEASPDMNVTSTVAPTIPANKPPTMTITAVDSGFVTASSASPKIEADSCVHASSYSRSRAIEASPSPGRGSRFATKRKKGRYYLVAQRCLCLLSEAPIHSVLFKVIASLCGHLTSLIVPYIFFNLY
jgi:hypothetical protein